MDNISDVTNCFGCGVCAMACRHKLINIRLNSEGFYEPYIADLNKCTNCGLCKSVCSFVANDLANNNSVINSYASWSNEFSVRRKCSSGGVGFELGRYLIADGYKVCAVRYNPSVNRAEHYIASTVEELIPSIGSKYIQSYTIGGLLTLDRKQKYLITGTPCQIDSLRRYVKKYRCEDNFILMDFFCHGVPSMLMWDQYVKEVEKKVGKVTYVSWRNKVNGWHDSWAMAIGGDMHGEPVDWNDSYNLLTRGKKGFLNSRLSQGDIFYKLFLSNSCLNKACYKDCRFKYDKSSADIRIGDMWGEKYSKDRNGVSGVLVFTDKGKRLVEACNCCNTVCDIKEVCAGQMKNRVKCPPTRRFIIAALQTGKLSLRQIYNRYQLPYKVLTLPNRIFKKIRRLFT